MQGPSESNGVFNMPSSVTQPNCNDEASAAPLPPNDVSREISKRRIKSRAKSQSKSRSARPRSLQKTPTPSDEHAEIDSKEVDLDLAGFLKELDDLEQRATQALQDLQNDISQCVTYMLDATMGSITASVDSVKSKVPQVQKLRVLNRSVKTQLRALDELDHS